MNSKVNILSCQFEPRINNKKKNYDIVYEFLSSITSEIDLLVLPEFFSTGITNDGFIKLAEAEEQSETIEFFAKIAKKYNTNVCLGTIIEKDGDDFYNTSYFLNRNGEILDKYRKIHLFSYMGGNEHLTVCSGDEIKVVEFDFGRIGASICFDIRFPLHYNKLIKMGAEIIVCPNAWCIPMNFDDKISQIKTKEMEAFSISRASENLVYFVTSSLQGKLGSGLKSCSNSMIVSPYGEVLAVAKEKNQAIFSQIDLSLVRKLKKEFPVYKID